MDYNEKFSCIMPTLPQDYNEIKQNLYLIFDMLPVDKIILIGSEELRNLLNEDVEQFGFDRKVDFINENELIPFDDVKQAYNNRLEEIETSLGKPQKKSRVGWYYQQFLKMEYCNLNNDEYYLCWDADTIPLRPIEMFSSQGVPFLDIKPEYMPSYFSTLNNLLGLGKVIEQSFISEHMLFKKSLMIQLIDEIMSASLPGNSFYEKIFSAIDQPFNGFSEFETYGTWVATRYPDEYRLRFWKSIRNTNFMIDRKELNEEDLNWLATGFDAASFERYQETFPVLTELFRNQRYREKLPADIFYKELLEAGVFGDYQNGGLMGGGCISPV